MLMLIYFLSRILDYCYIFTTFVWLRLVFWWRDKHRSWFHFQPTSLIASNKLSARTSETSVNFYQTTRRYNPGDGHLRTHRRKNLKSCLNFCFIFATICIQTHGLIRRLLSHLALQDSSPIISPVGRDRGYFPFSRDIPFFISHLVSTSMTATIWLQRKKDLATRYAVLWVLQPDFDSPQAGHHMLLHWLDHSNNIWETQQIMQLCTCSQTPSVYVPPLMCETKYDANTKQQVNFSFICFKSLCI
jgi:hypothetical protein